MTKPVRLRLSRRRGFDLQATSRRINGLPARAVTRPGPFGNPWRIAELREIAKEEGEPFIQSEAAKAAVDSFRYWLGGSAGVYGYPGTQAGLARLQRHLPEIRATNLACTCRLCPRHADKGKPLGIACIDCAPCHADILLEEANKWRGAPATGIAKP